MTFRSLALPRFLGSLRPASIGNPVTGRQTVRAIRPKPFAPLIAVQASWTLLVGPRLIFLPSIGGARWRRADLVLDCDAQGLRQAAGERVGEAAVRLSPYAAHFRVSRLASADGVLKKLPTAITSR